MLADLDLLLTAVFCTADDLLPERQKNARRSLTDAEVVTLCVAQAVMDIPSDREFLAVAAHAAGRPVPTAAAPARLPQAPAAADRDDRVADRRLCRMTAPVMTTRSSCSTRRRWSAAARWRPRGARSWPMPAAMATAARTRAGSGGCACTCAAPPTAPHGPRSWPRPTSPSARSRCACCPRPCAAASRSSATRATPAGSSPPTVEARFGADVLRPQRKNEPDSAVHLSTIRQRIESIFWTLKDRLGLERHRARTLAGLRAADRRQSSWRSPLASGSTAGSDYPAAPSLSLRPERGINHLARRR